MSRLPKPFKIEEMTHDQMRKLRNLRHAGLNRIRNILAGKVKSIYRKDWPKMHARAKQYIDDILLLDDALNDYSDIGVPMRIYP